VKRVLIIGSRLTGTKNDPYLLAEKLQSHGLDVTVCFWEQLVFAISPAGCSITHEGKDIARDIQPELVIALGWYKNGSKSFYRDVAFTTALYFEASGIRLWNSEMLAQRSTTKLSCMMQLALAEIPVPQTLFSMDVELLAMPEAPFIMKGIATSKGKDNFLVKNREEALEIARSSDGQYIVQPFLENDHDLRVVCFGGKPSLFLKRSRGAAATHLNNTSQGGQGQWLDAGDLPADLLTAASKISIIMKREMGGIDFIPDPASPFGYSCLEVNAIPQLTSGHDVEAKLDKLANSILDTESERSA
jgi:glutathione synthase/RimK-type ligase-like ATP-grasp enzyme